MNLKLAHFSIRDSFSFLKFTMTIRKTVIEKSLLAIIKLVIQKGNYKNQMSSWRMGEVYDRTNLSSTPNFHRQLEKA